MNRSLARSVIYATLSGLYAYPDEEVCAWIAGGAWLKPVTEALDFLIEDRFVDCLRGFGEAVAGKREDTPQELRREYARLFMDGFPRELAPPRASAYMAKEGPVSEKTAANVLAFYRERGFAFEGGVGDFPDHIAPEMRFMGTLAERAAQAAGHEKIDLEEDQMVFFSRFVLPWVSFFCIRLTDQTRLPFYRSAAALTRGFVAFEKNYLGVPEEDNAMQANDNKGVNV